MNEGFCSVGYLVGPSSVGVNDGLPSVGYSVGEFFFVGTNVGCVTSGVGTTDGAASVGNKDGFPPVGYILGILVVDGSVSGDSDGIVDGLDDGVIVGEEVDDVFTVDGD